MTEAQELNEDKILVSKDIQQYTDTIPLDHISVSGLNPREKVINGEDFEGLCQDLATNGLIHPILVRPVGSPDTSRYEVVCGHRRLEAARRLGWNSIRCTVRKMDDDQAYEIMGLENVNRLDFSPIEETAWVVKAWARAKAKGESQVAFAKRLGKTQSWVSNKVRISEAPEEVLELYVMGKIQDKHVLSLLPYREYAIMEPLMDYLTNTLKTGSHASASDIDKWAADIVRCEYGGTRRILALPYNLRDLEPFFDRTDCERCKRTKSMEIALGHPEPICLDAPCWDEKLERAREGQEVAVQAPVDLSSLDALSSPPAQEPPENLITETDWREYEAQQEEARAKDLERETRKVQKCHVLRCTNKTLPGSFWCEDHQTPISRTDAVKDEALAHLPVNVRGPAPTSCKCRICKEDIPTREDNAHMVRGMIAHLIRTDFKERHNKALQKFVSGLLNGKGMEELMRFFEVSKEKAKPKAPETRYFHCDEKDKGANALNVEEAMADLGCMKCDRRMQCKGPEEVE